jgi:hypothetical protein
MAKQKYVITSCLVGASAIACQLTWLSHCSRSTTLLAQSATWTEAQRIDARADATHMIEVGVDYGSLGFAAAIVALSLWVMALVRRETSTAVPFVLLIC